MSKRIYEAGRSTEGFGRGEVVTKTSEVKPGDILVLVSHKFQAENLIVVVPRPEGFTDASSGRIFYCQYFDPETRVGSNLMSIWDFEINGITGTEQVVYRAVPVKGKKRTMKILDNESLYKGHIIITLPSGYHVDYVCASAFTIAFRSPVLDEDFEPKLFPSIASAKRYIGISKTVRSTKI